MSDPFFSIIIPTKGRPQLIERAINSVITQDFNDYELVIVDNNIDDATYDVVAPFLVQDKVVYYKTGGLSMPDNWEFAASKTKGRFITFLTDRMYYVSEGVLGCIYSAIQEQPVNIVTWKWKNEDKKVDDPNTNQLKYKIVGYGTQEVLDGFLDGGTSRHWFNVTSPKGLNSCVSRTLFNQVIKLYGRFYMNLSPDFTSCFIQLFLEPKLLHIDYGLVISGGSKVSNGGQSVQNKKKLMDYIDELGVNYKNTYNHTPIKVLSVFNLMYNDLFSMAELTNSDLHWGDVNKVEYFTLVYGEIKNNLYKKDKLDDLGKWEEALSKESDQVREQVHHNIKNKEKSKTLIMVLKRIYKNKIHPLVKAL